MAFNQLGVGFGNSLDITQLDPAAALDVAGAMRIRAGCTTGGCQDKVLKSSNSYGLASWQTNVAGLTKITEGYGIDLGVPNDQGGWDYSATEIIGGEGIVAAAAGQTHTTIPDGQVAPATVQQFISGQCNSGINAMTGVTLAGGVTCQNFVTTVQAPTGSGLTLLTGSPLATTTAAVSGPVTLKIYTGVPSDNTGLRINASNQVALNVDTAVSPSAGDGLTISATGRVQFEPCANNGETWKYDTTVVPNKWVCATFPSPSTGMPGESVMYLRAKSSTVAPACPTAAGWTSGPTSGENAGGGALNNVRICYRTDRPCQVIYLRSTNSPPPSCTGVWTEAANSNEYAPGGTFTNYVRTCFVCS
ncbi:MAG: hypothetical protein HYT46_00415 [Candidatus Vogelbacteria bacterium]|nr:hypothetical protein [Candidatus Vogelbacteria bacterium]